MLSGDADAIKDRLAWINDDMENIDLANVLKLASELEEAEGMSATEDVTGSSAPSKTFSMIEGVLTTIIVFGFFFALCSGGLCAAVINKHFCKVRKNGGESQRKEAHTIDMQVMG